MLYASNNLSDMEIKTESEDRFLSLLGSPSPSYLHIITATTRTYTVLQGLTYNDAFRHLLTMENER